MVFYIDGFYTETSTRAQKNTSVRIAFRPQKPIGFDLFVRCAPLLLKRLDDLHHRRGTGG